jgi:hypothetical protein
MCIMMDMKKTNPKHGFIHIQQLSILIFKQHWYEICLIFLQTIVFFTIMIQAYNMFSNDFFLTSFCHFFGFSTINFD